MGLDFFKDGNELKQKSKEELQRDIDNIINENEKMIDEFRKKEDTYLKKNRNELDALLTKELSFVLISDNNDKKIYKFIKNGEEYSIEISPIFISYNKPKSHITYAYNLFYKNDNKYLQSLKYDEAINMYTNYTSYSKDISEYLKEYNRSKKVLEENTKLYNDMKDIEQEDLFLFGIKQSSGSISRYDENVKKYNDLIDFVKEIL